MVKLHLATPINFHQNYSGPVPNTSQIVLKSHFQNVVVWLSFHKSFLAALEPEELTDMASCQATLWHFLISARRRKEREGAVGGTHIYGPLMRL